jgi:hypothetical protein
MPIRRLDRRRARSDDIRQDVDMATVRVNCRFAGPGVVGAIGVNVAFRPNISVLIKLSTDLGSSPPISFEHRH